MVRFMTVKKKTFPIFAFRVEQVIKDELFAEIESVQTLHNKKKGRTGNKNKNDVIVEALRIGLKAMKKK